MVSVLCVAAVVLIVAECGDSSAADEPLPPEGSEVGDLAPPLRGRVGAGDTFQLEPDEAGATVIVFYRGAYCGLCRERLAALEEHRGAYSAAGADVLAVSLDSVDEVGQTVRSLDLGFPVVSVDSTTFERWDVLSAEGTPLPAEFVLDERGVIQFRQVGRNAADRAGDVALLAVLERMARPSDAP